MEINGTKGSLVTIFLGQLPNTLIFRGENITPQGDSWGEEVENILGIIIACNPRKLNTTWQNKQLYSISLVLKFHGGRVKWDKTVSLKLLGEAILALIENVCVRKLAQKMIIKMKNKLTSTALILIWPWRVSSWDQNVPLVLPEISEVGNTEKGRHSYPANCAGPNSLREEKAAMQDVG